MHNLRRLIVPLLLATMVILALAAPAFAIANPDTGPYIDYVYAFRNLIETGDQLYLVKYTIAYAALPTETCSQAFLFTLEWSTGTTVMTEEPYDYQDSGYTSGIVAFYFSASNAFIPTWGSTVRLKILGNPILTWPGAPPDTASTVTYWSSSTQDSVKEDLAERVLSIAVDLGGEWSTALTSTVSDATVLSTAGEEYFTASADYIQEMAPTAFASYFSDWDYRNEDVVNGDPNEGAIGMATQIIGSPLDLTNLAASFNMSVGWLGTILTLLVCGLIDVLIFGRRRAEAYAGPGMGESSSRGMILVDDFIIIAFWIIGILPTMFFLGMAFAFGTFTFFVMFFHKGAA